MLTTANAQCIKDNNVSPKNHVTCLYDQVYIKIKYKKPNHQNVKTQVKQVKLSNRPFLFFPM